MKIDDLNNSVSALSSVENPKKHAEQQQRQTAAKDKVNTSPQQISKKSSAISSNRILYNKIETANDQNLTVARKIREVDKTMDLVEEKVGNMRTSIEGVVKAYPPYPPGSSERVKAMRQFAALRKQIDQLIYPPPDDEAPVIPANADGDEPWDLSKKVALDLPELSIDAGDSELNNALNSLGKAHNALQQQHKAFIEDANRIIATLK